MEILKDNHLVTIRKKHGCFACCRYFPIGTKMWSQTCKMDDVYTVYSCETCHELTLNFKDYFIDEQEGSYPEACVCEVYSDFNVNNPEDLLVKLKEVNDNALRAIYDVITETK